jgi:DNA polymerase III subunit delta
MDLLSVAKNLTHDNVEPVYMLHGPERFIIDQLVSRIREVVLVGPMSDFNYQSIKVPEVSGAEIVAISQEIPMMAARRMILVENAHKLKPTDLEALDPYLAQPAPETVLVIVGDRFDLRRGPFARANKRGQIYKAEQLMDRGVGKFLKARIRQRGISIETRAIAAVGAAIGPDCGALDDALERLSLFAGDGNKVGEDDVAEVVTNVRQHSVFELVDAIGNRQPAKAIKLLEGLLARREEPLMVNAMVARHIRQLLGARIHVYLGTDQSQLPSLLGAPSFLVKNLLSQSRKFRGAALEAALARLSQADLELKSCKRSGILIVEEAILDLCLNTN